MNLRGILLAVGSAFAVFVAVAVAVNLGAIRPTPTAGPLSSLPPLVTAVPPPALPSFTIHLDHSVADGTRDPTAHKAQSKLWFAMGAWWAVMTAPERPAVTIHRLDPLTQTWIDTGTLVDERANANADAVWDGQHLVVATAVKSSGASAAARIVRYHFDELSARFVIDPDFPVRISDVGVEGIVVARDTVGTLWVAYTQEGQVYVNHSDGNDAVWGSPVPLPWPESLATPDDIAAVVALGNGRTGLLWTNQRIGAILFTSRTDGDPDGAWTEPEIAVSGAGLADDHLNAKITADGRLLVAAKTSLDEPEDSNAEAPLTLLLERRPDGEWRQHLFGRVRDHHTRPMLVVDDQAGVVYMFATSPVAGGTIYVKWSSFDDIVFPSGKGEALIAGDGRAVFADPTSTKDPVASDRGFVVLAFDRANRRYVHALIGGAGGPAATPWPEDPTGSTTVYFHDTFEPWSLGAVPGNGWELRDPIEGSIHVAPDATHGQVAVLAPAVDAPSMRACKPFAAVDARPIQIALSARASARGADDIVGLAVRGRGGDLVSVRFGLGGTFSYYDGQQKIRSEVEYRPGAWYRIEVEIDQVGRTASLKVTDEMTGNPVVSVARVAWRTPDAPAATALCVQAPGGTDAPSFGFDEVIVSQR